MDRSEVVNTSTSEKEGSRRGNQIRSEDNDGQHNCQTTTSSNKAPQSSNEGPIKLSRIAAEKLKEALSTVDSGCEIRVRIAGRECCGYTYQMGIDLFADGDTRCTSEGVSIVIDAASLLVLKGTSINYIDTEQGSGFSFNNPNDTPCCGSEVCGGCPSQED